MTLAMTHSLSAFLLLLEDRRPPPCLSLCESTAVPSAGLRRPLCIRSIPPFERSFQFIALFVSKHFVSRLFLRCHRLLGLWTYVDVLVQVTYLIINLFLVGFQWTSMRRAAHNTGIIASINMIPVFFGFHLWLVADLLGVSLSTCRRIHRLSGTVAFVRGLLHMLVSLRSKLSYSLKVPANLYGLIVSGVFRIHDSKTYGFQGSSSVVCSQFYPTYSAEVFVRSLPPNT